MLKPNKSFIQNINYLAQNLSTLEKSRELLTPAAIRAMESALALPFEEIVKDLKKGVSSAGKRKLDIETSGNGTGNLESVLYDKITVESVNGLHKLTYSFTPTSRADELLTGLKEAIREFNESTPENAAVVDAEIELLLQRSNLNIPLWLIRVTDLGAEHTRLSRVILHVSEGSSEFAKKPDLEFTWSKSTSSILLLGASQDFIAAGVNRAEDAQNAAEVAELNAKSSEESAEISAVNAENSAIASELSSTESASSAEEASVSAATAKSEVAEALISGVADATEQANRAEAARDAAFVNADVYPDIATGLAAVAVGEQFQVVDADGLFISRYERDGSTAVPVSRLPSANTINRLPAGTLNSDIDFTRSRNLLDMSTATREVVISISGEIVPNSDYHISDFIAVKPGAEYSTWQALPQHNIDSVAQYDIRGNFLSRLGLRDGKYYDAREGTSYVRLNMQGSFNRQRMFCEGESPSEYVPPSTYIHRLKVFPGNLEHGSIPPEKTSFIETGVNLLDIEAVTSGVTISIDTGEIVPSAGSNISDLIHVKPATTYSAWWEDGKYTQILSVAQYDIRGNFLFRVDLSGEGQITTSGSTASMRLIIQGNSTAPRMFCEGDLPEEYVPYEFSIPKLRMEMDARKFEDGSITPEKTSFISSSRNLLDLSASTHGMVVSNDGVITPNASYSVSDFIPVVPNTQYRLWWEMGAFNSIAQYDENQQFLRRRGVDISTRITTTGNDVYYVRLNFQLSPAHPRMFYEGTDEIPYVEYGKYLKGVELSPEYVDQILHAPDRPMVDMPIDGLFVTDEDYTEQWSDFGQSTTAAEVYAKYDALVAAHPEYVSKQVLGDDDFGNEIAVYHFTPSRPSSTRTPRYPKIFLTTGIHGPEKVPGLTAYLMFKSLCDEWHRDPLLEATRFNVDILIIPVSNPSGWDDYTRTNRNGVDINRNFPEGWQLTDPTERTYGGPEPLSEPESMFISQVLKENPDIDAFYDFHNYWKAPNDTHFIWIPTVADTVQNMAQMLLQRMTRHWRNEYSWIPSDPEWFAGRTDGSHGAMTQDHAHQGHGVPFAGVLEVADRWWVQPGATTYNFEHRQSSVNALVNWLLINVREIIRRG